MSHGATEKCEPNFTPLLDLVLQLVMFFMLCANFVMAETDVEIKLPIARTASPLESRQDYVMYLNVNQDGWVIFAPNARPTDSSGREIEVSKNPIELQFILKNKYAVDSGLHSRRVAEAERDRKTPPPPPLIILRVHRECAFEKTYPIMKACRAAGYSRVQLRAILAGEA